MTVPRLELYLQLVKPRKTAMTTQHIAPPQYMPVALQHILLTPRINVQ